MSLRELLRRTGPLEPTAAMYVMYSVLLGLVEVHDREIVHRALRPENVLLDADATVKVIDIGLARPGSDGPPANPVYAAPELWFGDQPNPSTDVFAAAAVLYECLSGSPPRGASGAYLGRSGQSPDAATAALGPELAGGPVGAYLAHGLATDPAARHEDARAAAGRLNAVAVATCGASWYGVGRAALRRRLAGQAPLVDDAERRLPFRAPVPAGGAPAWWLAEPDDWQPDDWQPGDWQPGDWQPADPPPAPFEPDPTPLVIPDGRSHRAASHGGRRLVAVGVITVVASAATVALTALTRPDRATGLDASPPVASATPDPATPAGAQTAAPAEAQADATSGAQGGAQGADAVAPAGLRVTGRSTSAVSLAWADDDVAGYVVLRDGARVGTTDEAGFTDRGLTADTGYTYAVAALDAAGNPSERSAPVTASTLKYPDGRRPTAPTGVGVTAAAADRITLTWGYSRDDTGVVGYQILRDGRMVATVARPGFTDTGLQPGASYRYQVRAVDASDNVSAASSAVTGRTVAAPAPTSGGPSEMDETTRR